MKEVNVKSLTWGHAALEIEFTWDDETPFSIRRTRAGSTALNTEQNFPLVHVVTAEFGHVLASERLVHTEIGQNLRYMDHRVSEKADTAMLDVRLATADGLTAVVTFWSPHGVGAFRSTVRIENSGTSELVLRSVSSWGQPIGSSLGREASVDDWTLLSADSEWLGESRWVERSLRANIFPRLGQQLTNHNPRGEYRVVSTGTWSTGKHSPMAGLLSDTAAWVWQIEHNGSWRWEVGEDTAGGYFALSGPTELDHGWHEILPVGGSFTAVPAAIALASDFTGAVAALTDLRRASRLTASAEEPRIIFNDYMNALNGDPTTDRLEPLVDAAAEAGAEVFLIDAGWYDDGFDWWDSVGEWIPSTRRFPDGLGRVIDRIRAASMIPGLWLEPEVVGVRSPIADTLPKEAFLQRHGQRIVEQGRFHLDMRHPAAITHLDQVIDRLRADFGIGYFKLDYNINPGVGTDRDADSLGSGLLGHNRAHLEWLRMLHARHPDLMLENCGSGGMRADYATLANFELQSTTDQQDERLLPPIAANAFVSVLPEQAGIWGYPQAGMDTEQAAYCLATPLLGRYFLSGYLNRMAPLERELVAHALDAYKRIRFRIPRSHPFWPTGLAEWDAPLLTSGLQDEDADLITVWNRGTQGPFELALPHRRGEWMKIETLFPLSLPEWATQWNREAGVLTVTVPAASLAARTFQLSVDR